MGTLERLDKPLSQILLSEQLGDTPRCSLSTELCKTPYLPTEEAAFSLVGTHRLPLSVGKLLARPGSPPFPTSFKVADRGLTAC